MSNDQCNDNGLGELKYSKKKQLFTDLHVECARHLERQLYRRFRHDRQRRWRRRCQRHRRRGSAFQPQLVDLGRHGTLWTRIHEG